MADNTTETNTTTDVAEIQKKLENTAITTQTQIQTQTQTKTQTQTQSSTDVAPGNDIATKDTENNKQTIPPIAPPKGDVPNEETKLEERTDSSAPKVEEPQAIVDNSNIAPQTQVPQVPQVVQVAQVAQVAQVVQVAQVTQPQQNQTDTKSEDDDDELTNLIINYLPPTMSEGHLATLFSPYGLLQRCKIVVDLQTLRSRGYGFVKYDNAVSAERAMTALNGLKLNGKKLKVAFARPQCKAITNANLYITNVPPQFTDSDLVKLFKDFGGIVECRVLKDQNGHSRGVGFVRMDTHHNAIEALQVMDQYVIDDKHPPLLVKLAQRRVPRRYWNNQNRNQGPQRDNRRQNQGPQQRDKQNKGRKTPNRKYYPKGGYRQQQQQGADIGGAMMPHGGHGMNVNNQHHNRGSPSKQRGYYRPRQQYKQQNKAGSTTYNNNGGGDKKGGGRMSGGGPPYFPAPMYQQEPYAMAPAAQYGQPQQQAQYAANMHLTTAAINNAPNPSNPSNVGPSSPTSYNVLVFNLPKHFNVDHIINMYAKFGPVQSVNIRHEKKGPVGIISYFYFDDAQRAQNETNQLEVGNDGDRTRLETIFQPPVK